MSTKLLCGGDKIIGDFYFQNYTFLKYDLFFFLTIIYYVYNQDKKKSTIQRSHSANSPIVSIGHEVVCNFGIFSRS